MQLERLYDKLNPAQLKREISNLQNELYRLNALKQNRDRETAKDRKPQGSLEYISNWGSVSAFKYIINYVRQQR